MGRVDLLWSETVALNVTSKDVTYVRENKMMITAQDIEKKLIGHRAVKEVCVLAAPQDDTDYAFHAFIVPVDNESISVFECQAECHELLEGHGVLIEMLQELPKSAMGRISRDALRDLCCSVD